MYRLANYLVATVFAAIMVYCILDQFTQVVIDLDDTQLTIVGLFLTLTLVVVSWFIVDYRERKVF